MCAVLRRLLLAAALLLPLAAAAEETVHTLATRPGVSQRFLLLQPEHPVASLILFSGGDGDLRIGDDGQLGWGKGNFLVRTRTDWAAQGFQVAVVDAPSDHLPRGLGRFRESAEHADDIAAVIHFLKQQMAVPVWLVGTSRGTTSAAAVAIHLAGQQLVDGVVLTSTILSRDGNVPGMALDKLTVPVLLVHHRSDQCFVTPYGQIGQLMERLHGTTSELITIEGGRNVGDACEAKAYHGYNGVEAEVVQKVADWIKAHSPR